MWIRGLLKELKIEGVTPEEATVIYADNQGAIKLAENPIFQRRSKHIAVRYHYTRDLIEQKEIKLEYKSTKCHDPDIRNFRSRWTGAVFASWRVGAVVSA